MIDRAASAVVSPTTSNDLLRIMPAMIASLFGPNIVGENENIE